MSQPKTTYITVKDFSVSGESFDLIHNENFDYLETTPQPSLEKLPDYYESEDYISHTDSKRNLFEKTYHFIKSIALKRKLHLINHYLKEEKYLLDVGCGTGDFLQVAKTNHWNISGVEPNEQARIIANKKTNNSVFDVDQLQKFEDSSFNVITLWHVLEHLPNLEDQILLFKKLLKPDGVLIIAVPNYKSYDALYYKNYWAAFDVPRHLWHFSKTAIKRLVALENMIVEKEYPMIFDSFYVCLLSEKYKTGRMNVFRGFWVGLVSNLKALFTKEFSSIIYCIKNR
jgi:2-polyprenyl-3-methyl-5-hydroxy-6-metoxy-1,4-benzoquinol methylase